MDIMLIWIVMAVLYGVFWLWYSGTKGKLSQTEVESYMQQFESRGVNTDNLANLRHFLAVSYTHLTLPTIYSV